LPEFLASSHAFTVYLIQCFRKHYLCEEEQRAAEEGAVVELSGSFTGSPEQKSEFPPTNGWGPVRWCERHKPWCHVPLDFMSPYQIRIMAEVLQNSLA